MEIIQHLILIVISHTVAYLSRWHQKQCKDLHVFDNLEFGIVLEKPGKSLEFWVQKSVQTLCSQ